jgi:Flp pilus assembly pilin Flp
MSSRRIFIRPQSSLARDERGLSTVEYVILLVLIAIAGLALWKGLGDTVVEKIKGSNEKLEQMEIEKDK